MLGFLLFAPAPDPVPEPVPTSVEAADVEADTPSDWRLGGFVDLSYQLNFNFPENHLWRGTSTSPRTNEPIPNLVGAYLLHPASAREPWSFELAVHAGTAADALVNSEPLPGDGAARYTGPETWKNISRANAGVLIRKTKTMISAGLFTCPIGIGVFWNKENWHYTAAWELNGVPFYLAGAQVSQDLGEGFRAQGWVVSGWQTIADVNHVPSYMGGLTWSGNDVEAQSLVFFGAEGPDPHAEAWRVFSNTQVIWNRERFGIGGAFDFGRERLTWELGEPVARWLAFELTTRWRVLGKRDTWDMAIRGDAHWDPDGRMFGVPQWLAEATYTNAFRLMDALLIRVEYRYDRATAADGFFYRRAATTDDAPGLAHDQHTAILALTGYIDTNLPRRRRAR